MSLSDGHQVSWMNIADEGTTSHLKAFVYDEKFVNSIDLQTFTRDLNGCFTTWGLPESIKIDNGLPIVIPRSRDVPTKAQLWWIGLGIEVIQNTPRRPQENGAVEALQGIMKNWSNPSSCSTLEALQKRLDEESDFQRNDYQMPKKKYQTRTEIHPELLTNQRQYDPNKFNMQLVYEHLSNFVWTRKVQKSGEVTIMSTLIYLGKKFAKETITISFDPTEKSWICRKLDGTMLKESKKGVPNEKEIKEFATISKNKVTT